MGFKEDAQIDKLALDYEWLRQSTLYHKYSTAYANAVFERDKAKERLELVRAELDSEIRKYPEDFGLTKVTEPAVASAIVQDERYQEAKNEYLDTVREMNIVAGAKTAMEHKKTALEVMAKLYLSGYWGEAKIPSEARKKYSESDNEQTEALKRNKRLKSRRNK